MNQLNKQLLLSAVLGFVFFYLVKLFWGYFPNINPITNWLLSCCASKSWVTMVIQAHDIFINILLCIPLAIYLANLKSSYLWLNTAFAVIPSFLYSNYHLLQSGYSGWEISDFAFGWSIELLCLPIALLTLLFWTKRENT